MSKSIIPELTYNSRKRLAMVKFLGGKCKECGGTEHLHIHHKNKRRSDNLIKNLDLLCHDCHKKKHRSRVLSGEALRELNKSFKRFDTRMKNDPKFRMKIQQKIREIKTQTKLETKI